MSAASTTFVIQVGTANSGLNQMSTTIGSMSSEALLTGIGPSGFAINGISAEDESVYSVSGAGDVNGDGLADLIVGAYKNDPNGRNSGASFVVFGKAGNTGFELSAIGFSSNSGFVVNGASDADWSGYSVSGAGDVNGDGLADLIMGSYGDDPNGDGSGASHVLFGKADEAAVELSAIDARSNQSRWVPVSVTSGTAATGSIDRINTAIKRVNDQRSDLGAVSNWLNHTVNNLTNISTNLSAAKGGIEDADFALETTKLVKNKILCKISMAVLAQSNAQKQHNIGLLQS